MGAMTSTNDAGTTADTKTTAVETSILGRKEDKPEETVPGWTIMRPLKRKGNKRNDTGSVSKLIAPTNSDGSPVDSKTMSDLKITDTNGSGDVYGGVGEVEALQDLRSDDELLEDDEEESTRNRGASPMQNLESNGSPVGETNGGITQYKVYKRRWFGLVQLVLLNVVVSWDVSSTIAVSYHVCC